MQVKSKALAGRRGVPAVPAQPTHPLQLAPLFISSAGWSGGERGMCRAGGCGQRAPGPARLCRMLGEPGLFSLAKGRRDGAGLSALCKYIEGVNTARQRS